MRYNVQWMELFNPGRGGYTVSHGEAPLQSSTLTHSYNTLAEEVPFSYTFYWQMVPLSKTCKCTVFKIWINHKTRTFTRLFNGHEMHLLALLGLLHTKMTDFPTLSYGAFSLTWPASMQIYWNKREPWHKKRVQLPQDWFGTTTWTPWRHVKKAPFSGRASPYKPLKGVPPPGRLTPWQ